MPSIEFRGSDPFLHFADGSVYRITGSGSSRTFEGYPLTKVTYPTGASSNYGYEAAAQKKFLGANGYLEFYRIAERYDSLKGLTGAAQKTQYTKYTYEAGKNFSGYGTAGESNPDSLSAGFSVTNSMRTFTDPDTVAPSQDRLVESMTYNNKHLLTTYTAEKQGEYKESTAYAYDAALELPLSVRQSYYSIDGSEASSYTDEFYTYDTYGNVRTVKLLLENNRSQLTTYTYDSNSLFPLSVKQNVTKNGTTRTVEQKYEYTSGTGWEKSYLDPNAVKAGTSAASSRKYETEYDLIGRVTRIKSSMIAGETSKPERAFTYTYNTSNQTYTTQGVDEEGNKTISLYDGLGRIREVKAPAANTVMDSTTASHSPVTKQAYSTTGWAK